MLLMRTIPATEFKAKCLSLLDQVAEQHETVLISKRGVPVAKLVPLDEPVGLAGCMTVLTEDDAALFSTGESWEAMEDRSAPSSSE